MTAARLRLASVLVVVVTWSADLDVIFVIFSKKTLLSLYGRRVITWHLRKNSVQSIGSLSQSNATLSPAFAS